MAFVRGCLTILFIASVAAADDLRTLDNKTIVGVLVAADDNAVSLKTADGVVKTPLDDVIGVELRGIKGVAAGISFTEIRLVDDTTLLCGKYAIKGNKVQATLLSGQDIALPLGSVASILRSAEDAVLKKKWTELLTTPLKRDRVVIYRGGEVNALPGAIGDASEDGKKIKFRSADGDSALDVPLANLHGMIFYRPDAGETAKPVCVVYDTVGNALAATKVTADGGKITINSTIPNVTIQCDLTAIARLDYNMGKLTSLSDLVPTKIVQDSAVGLIVAYKKDVNLDGDSIVLDRPYAKGLSLHAHTELEYDLKRKYKKFSAVLGVDARVGSDSQPTVTIEVDGRAVFSEVITAKAVVPISLDIAKAATLRIIVTSRNFLDLNDHVTIANPKLTQ